MPPRTFPSTVHDSPTSRGSSTTGLHRLPDINPSSNHGMHFCPVGQFWAQASHSEDVPKSTGRTKPLSSSATGVSSSCTVVLSPLADVVVLVVVLLVLPCEGPESSASFVDPHANACGAITNATRSCRFVTARTLPRSRA